MRTRIRNILLEATQKFVSIDPSSMPPEDAELLYLFTQGYCSEFAIALNKKTGLPLMRVVLGGWGRKAELAHAFVKVSNGVGLDATGENRFKDILANQERDEPAGINKWYEIRSASESMLAKATEKHGLDHSMIEKAEGYIDKYIMGNILRETVDPDNYRYPRSSEDVKYLYHSTGRENLQSILKKGLVPKKQWNGMLLVYLGTYELVDLYMGIEDPVVLRIDFSKLDPLLLRPDDVEFKDMYGEGWENAPWQESLDASGQVAYAGKIPPDAIEVVEDYL